MAIIYCDMDGVLTDFEHGAESLLGHQLDNSNIDEVLQSDFATILSKKTQFWIDLPPMPEMKVLWKFINKYHAHILSAKAGWERERGTKEYSRIGKLQWIKQHLQIPLNRVHIVNRKDKAQYAISEDGPNILIDDLAKNIREFEAAGGIGVLHTSAKTTITALQQLGYH